MKALHDVRFMRLITVLALATIVSVSCTAEPDSDSPSIPANTDESSRTGGVTNAAGAATETADFVQFRNDARAGANVYVPVYSHIYQQNRNKTFNLTTTLSIRNTDLEHTITVRKVYYYDSHGELVERFLDQDRTLGPLSSTSFVVEEEDLRGGVGANFLVLWEATAEVTRPVIEAVMISTSQQQGISLISEGRELQTVRDNR